VNVNNMTEITCYRFIIVFGLILLGLSIGISLLSIGFGIILFLFGMIILILGIIYKKLIGHQS